MVKKKTFVTLIAPLAVLFCFPFVEFGKCPIGPRFSL